MSSNTLTRGSGDFPPVPVFEKGDKVLVPPGDGMSIFAALDGDMMLNGTVFGVEDGGTAYPIYVIKVDDRFLGASYYETYRTDQIVPQEQGGSTQGEKK